MKDKIIRIHWSEPVPLDESLKSDMTKEQGLYYITRIFGEKETSLYLGIARRHNAIRNRLRYHRDHWLSTYKGKKFVRIGRIIYPKNMDIERESEAIDHAESAILYDPAHKKLFPANIDKRGGYTYFNLYRIENEGDIFELKPVIRMHEQE